MTRCTLRERGAVSLAMTLILLIALSGLTLIGSRVALVEHRIAANSTRADAAFAAAEGGVQAALSYVLANRSQITLTSNGGWMHNGSNPKWVNCSSGMTSPPCGDGEVNLYGAGWKYYGPVPNLPTLPGEYQFTDTVWLVSKTLTTDPASLPWVGCLNLALTAVVPTVTATLVGTVNALLSLIGPGLGLPANLCLPINFSQLATTPPPSKINPTLYAVAEARSSTDTVGAIGRVRLALQRTSIFANLPPAALMVKGTANLTGDLRIWGNPRPPTIAPNDFSVLNLNDIAGLNITNLLGVQINSNAGSLAPLLNLTVAEVLALNANVTFPLSIWSQNTTTLNSGAVGPNILRGSRTCTPQWGGAHSSPCLPLSQAVSIPAGSIAPLVPLVGVNLPLKFPDIQDPSNLVSTVGGLVGTTPVPPFPADLLSYTFGYTAAEVNDLKRQATLLNNCDSLNNDSVGLFWVSGNCQLNGNIGKPGEPSVIITEGNLNLTANAVAHAVVYMHGGGTKTISGTASPNRPTLRGALLVDGNLVSNSGVYNVVYDQMNVRAAGFLAGGFAPLPGGWNDGWSSLP